MRIAALSLAALAFSAAAFAAPVWTAPGWYQVADTIVGPFVIKGPFATEGDCRATLPPNNEDEDYGCEYLSKRPAWDD